MYIMYILIVISIYFKSFCKVAKILIIYLNETCSHEEVFFDKNLVIRKGEVELTAAREKEGQMY